MIFEITHYKEVYETYEIEASSKEEAKAKFEESDMLDPTDINVKDSEIISVEEKII